MQILSVDVAAAHNDSRCTWDASWAAWRCLETDFAQLGFRSLGPDNYTHSLAPFHVFGDDGFGNAWEMDLFPYQVPSSAREGHNRL